MNKRIIVAMLMLALLITLLLAPRVLAAPRAIQWPSIVLSLYASGLTQPTTITHANDNSGRMFVTERAGTIRLIKNGIVVGAPFLNIGATGANRVGTGGPEEGLLGLAFAPGYGATRNRFYVFYTNPAGNLVIARYATSANPDLADGNSEQIVLTINHPFEWNHDGGQLQFGADGFLYIGAGDGGGGGDPYENAQNPNALLGKILRINVETGNPLTYTIPVTNPYTQTVGYRGEIWALGLRNPWRFSFDRLTRDLYIGDVGQGTREEIDFQPADSAGGANYGWDNLEGSLCYEPSVGCVIPPNYSAPVAEYSHAFGCSVTGGYVYRGAISQLMSGIYFYADYCSGRIWGLKNEGGWQTQELKDTSFTISTFGEDQVGNVYLADYGAGKIYLLKADEPVFLPIVLK